MKTSKLSFLLIAAVLVSFGFYFSGRFRERPERNDKPGYDEQVVQNYTNFCAGCHGYHLEKFADDNWMYARSEDQIAAIIRQGEEISGMPSFANTFSDEEIEALTEYVLHAAKAMAAEIEQSVFSQDLARQTGTAFWARTVVSGLDSPWGLEFLPGGDLLIAERNGRLSRYNDDDSLVEISGLPPIRVGGQGGLMDLELHPEYESNGWIYISYSYFDSEDPNKGNTAIMRARLDGNTLVQQETIYLATPTVSTQHHYGCRIEFDREGYLYFAVGDRGRRDEYPQSLSNSNGKVHRLYDDGRIPEDNPFVTMPDAEKSVYSYGHRNIQGMAIHPVTGEIWTHEHGPKGGDEINIVRAGANYGWPVISYGINYDGTVFTDLTHKEGMEQPLLYYVPSIAPCGMAFVTGTRYKDWENNLLVGSLRFEYLERVELLDDKVVGQERLLEGIGRVRNVEVSPDGYIYVAVENPGKILKLISVDEE